MAPEITPETMQRAEWQGRLLAFVLQNVKHGGGHQAVIDMISAGLEQAHADGVGDAMFVVSHMRDASSGDRAYALGVAADALQELQRRNLRDAEGGQT